MEVMYFLLPRLYQTRGAPQVMGGEVNSQIWGVHKSQSRGGGEQLTVKSQKCTKRFESQNIDQHIMGHKIFNLYPQ